MSTDKDEEPAIAYVLRGDPANGVFVGLWSGSGKWLGNVSMAHYLDSYSRKVPNLYVTENTQLITPAVKRRQLPLPLPKGK